VKGLKRGLFLLAIAAVAVAAFSLRLRAVERLPIDYDEDDYLAAAQHYSRALLEGDVPEILQYRYNYEHPALVKLLYGVVLTRLPQEPEVPQLPSSAPPAPSLPQPQWTALRLTSAVLGTLEALALALLSPLGGLFLATHTFTIKYTSQAMLEALPALTSLLAVMAYARARGRRNAWLALSALMLGLTAAGKYLYAVAGVAIALHWAGSALRVKGRERWRSLLVLLGWGVLSLVVFILFDPPLWPDPISRLRESLLFSVTYSQGGHVQSAGYPFFQPLLWISQPVPWHPGVFVILPDVFILLLALIGLRRLAQRRAVFAVWLAVGLVFLLVWPTKWPQYILVITAPLCLAAAEGTQVLLIEPLVGALRRWRAGRAEPGALRALARRESRKALPWLIPGLLALTALALFPLVYQLAMALTDFSGPAIKDGMQGGVWREVWLGLTGQVEAVVYQPFAPSNTRQVHYAGPRLLLNMLLGSGSVLLAFEALWTVLSVATQTALGLGLALLLNRRGLIGRRFWNALFILPWAVPEFVGAMSWAQIFDTRFGWAALAARTWSETPGYSLPQAAQSNALAALGMLLTAGLWVGFPLMLLASTAGLKALPPDVYDSAALDGAGRWQTFRYVVWPMLLPLLAPAMLLRGIFAFNQFYLFSVFQTPYPMTTLAALSYTVFNSGGGAGRAFAFSAVINVVTVAFLLLFVLLFNRWSRAAEGVTYA